MDESVRARTGLNSPYLSCGLAEQKRRERRPHHARGPRAENHGGEDTRVARPRGASPRSKRLVGHPCPAGSSWTTCGREGGREESAKAKSRSRPRYSTPAPRPQRKAAETGAVAVRFPQNREPSLVPGLLQSRFALWLRYFWWAARPRAGRRGGGPGPDPDVDVDATRFDSSPARRPPRQTFSFLLRGLRLFFFPLVFLTPATSSPCKRLVLMRSRLSQAHPHFKRLYWVRRSRLFQSDSRIVTDDCLRIAGAHL